jgi:hypothetical protein
MANDDDQHRGVVCEVGGWNRHPCGGALSQNFGRKLFGDGREHFVIEGDEYDTLIPIRRQKIHVTTFPNRDRRQYEFDHAGHLPRPA